MKIFKRSYRYFLRGALVMDDQWQPLTQKDYCYCTVLSFRHIELAFMIEKELFWLIVPQSPNLSPLEFMQALSQ